MEYGKNYFITFLNYLLFLVINEKLNIVYLPFQSNIVWINLSTMVRWLFFGFIIANNIHRFSSNCLVD